MQSIEGLDIMSPHIASMEFCQLLQVIFVIGQISCKCHCLYILLSYDTLVWGILSLLCVILLVCLFVIFLFVSLYGYEFLSGGKS